MKETSRSHHRFARQAFAFAFTPLLAMAGLLTLQESGTAQDANTSPVAAPPPPAAGLDTFGSTNAIVIAKPRRNQISVSGDYSMEQGTITIPIGYSLKTSLQGFSPPTPNVFSTKRSSDYEGGTISYSHGQAWFFDVSYAQGTSTGTQDLNIFGRYNDGASGPFTLDDNWYQAYVRYAFPKLRGKKLSAYVRVGATYVDSTLSLQSQNPPPFASIYKQNDKTTDIYGNLGLGATYAFFTKGRFSMGLQGEIEGLGGERTQKSLETISTDPELVPSTASIDNTVYGGLGKGTLHLEYRLGSSGLCRLFMDAGAQYQFLEVSYPGLGNQNETLYGPYVKLGLRYSF
jgi:hypothetical protein